MTGARQVLDPEVVRVRLLDDAGRSQPSATQWAARVDGAAPLVLTLDQDSAGLVQVTVSAVRHPRCAQLVDAACPRSSALLPDLASASLGAMGGMADRGGGPSLGLDLWVEETDPDAIVRGYLWQHWALPRLVLERVTRSDDPLRIVGDPAGVPEALATGLAIEHEARANEHDLWWPSDVKGARIAPPVRTYQFVRETALPPVPV